MSYVVKFITEAGGCNKELSFKNQTRDDIKEILCNDMSEDPYINFWYGQNIEITNGTNNKKISIEKFIKMILHINDNTVSNMEEVSSLDKECSCGDECDKCVDNVLYNHYEWITNVLFECDMTEYIVSDDKTQVKVIFKGDLLQGNSVILHYNIDYLFFNEL